MPETRGDDGRARLLKALRSPVSRGQLVAAVLLAALGFAGVVQVRATGADDDFTGARQADLVALLDNLALATDRAEAEIADLAATRDALRGDSQATDTALRLAEQQVETLGILAGTLPAVGTGVRITVRAQPGEVGTDQLLNGLQELRDAGAEAIEVNDEVRVVAQTAISDAAASGSSPGELVIDGSPLRPPYVIDVIGDPGTLAAAVQFIGGFATEVEQVGGTVEVEQRERVEVGTTLVPPAPRFAAPVSGSGESG